MGNTTPRHSLNASFECLFLGLLLDSPVTTRLVYLLYVVQQKQKSGNIMTPALAQFAFRLHQPFKPIRTPAPSTVLPPPMAENTDDWVRSSVQPKGKPGFSSITLRPCVRERDPMSHPLSVN